MLAEAKLLPAPTGTEWRRFECSDCPDEDNRFTYLTPIEEDVSSEASGPIEFCPECNGYLSFIPANTYTKLEVVRVPRVSNTT